MPRDYKTRATRKRKKSVPGYVWLLSGLAIGLFIAFIVYLDKQPDNDKDFGSAVQEELEKLKLQQTKTTTKKTEPAKDEDVTEKKEQKFNFYTILPELEVFIPASETRPPETPSKTKPQQSTKKTTKPQSNKQYVLQVGSFQSLSDAEKLKANVAFLGLSAHVQHVTVNKQTWHRVRTGPYKSKQQLYKNQKTLKKNGIHAISMELK